jgi:ABC-type uncharacterized transport system substrate-binding protein
VRRRTFITLLGGAAASWPLAARAQQHDRMRRIGVLMANAESDPETQRYIKAFLQGLQELGWAHGRNVQIEYRWGGANLDRIRTYAAELVELKPDVILAQTALVVAPLQRETRTVPIVFLQIVDPVESGLVASLARPGGNLTGFTPFEFSTTTKWLEILREIAPGVTRVATILNPVQSPQVGILRAIETVAGSVGVLLTAAGVSDAAEIERAVSDFARESNGGLIVRGAEPRHNWSPRADHRTGRPAPPARGLRLPLLRRRRRRDLLWSSFRRPVPASGRLCRPHP